MKVLLDVSAVHAPLSGIGRYARELARHLPAMPGVENVLFLRGGTVSQAFDAEDLPDAGHHGNSRRFLSRLPILRQALGAYRGRRAARLAEHLDSYRDHIYLSPNFTIPGLRAPAIATIHDLSVFRYPQFHPRDRVDYLQREIRHSVERADHLLTDSRYIRNELIDRFDLAPEQVSAVPLGVDPDFHPRPESELTDFLAAHGLAPGRYILTVGTLEPRKNLGALLRAHACLPAATRRRYPLVIAGPYGWHSRDILAQARTADAGEVIYLEYLPEADLPLLYSGAGLFCCTSHYEGFGLPVLEALSSGVPVVCADNSSLTELASGCAMMWRDDDPAQLAQLLARALEDSDWRDRATKAGVQASTAFSWRATAEGVSRVLARVAGGGVHG